MVAAAGGTDVLLAYPLVGPNLVRFARWSVAIPLPRFARWSIIPNRPAPWPGPRRTSIGRFQFWWISRLEWAGPGSIPASRPRRCTR